MTNLLLIRSLRDHTQPQTVLSLLPVKYNGKNSTLCITADRYK